VSTMNLSSLNVDVLLYLMKFVEPDDRFSLVVSGILKGFENANEGTDLQQRYCEHFYSGTMCKVIINLFYIQNQRFCN
jgi:hypothetical protein